MSSADSLTLGAIRPEPGAPSCQFRVWAPSAESVEVAFEEPERLIPMQPTGAGHHTARVEDVPPGALYRYRLRRPDGSEATLPDPASRHQPRGVHGPSQVVEPPTRGADDWRGRPREELVLYELHVGTFTPEGTFDAVVPHLRRLVDLGVTAIELMPVAQFPGARNWGYDGVFPFAAQSTYGGPEGLARLVAAAHDLGLAVALDVVYNHLGPEGNVLGEYGPYFTERYATPWGDALNFDGPASDHVRRFFVENALYWTAGLGIDILRLDAVHSIVDASERPFLAELTEAVQESARRSGRRVQVIAESASNTLRYLRAREMGGCGMDAQWSDDFHHALHAALTGEAAGYYRDFAGPGDLERLGLGLEQGFVYTGQYSPFRDRRHGEPPREMAGSRFVVFSQNHDQTGNRATGERLASLVSFEATKLAAGVVLLSPFLPLLFMGEESWERAPFLYFVDHEDPDLVEAVRQGRKREFGTLHGETEVPDPAAPETFERSRIDPAAGTPEARSRDHGGRRGAMRSLYRELLALRRELSALARLDRGQLTVRADGETRLLRFTRRDGADEVAVAANFGSEPVTARPLAPVGDDGRATDGAWTLRLATGDERWAGPGSALPPTLEADAELELPGETLVLYHRNHQGHHAEREHR